MIKYVLCYIENGFGIVTIQKKRPDWQAGTITLPGGHIEEGETWENASIRETKEETNLDSSGCNLCGIIYCHNQFQVYVSKLHAYGQLISMTDEKADYMPFADIMRSNTLPNLKVMLPFLKYNIGPFLINMCFDSHQVFKVNICINLAEYP